MARLRRYLNVLNGWDQVAAAQEANAAEFPQLDAFLAKLRRSPELYRQVLYFLAMPHGVSA